MLLYYILYVIYCILYTIWTNKAPTRSNQKALGKPKPSPSRQPLECGEGLLALPLLLAGIPSVPTSLDLHVGFRV